MPLLNFKILPKWNIPLKRFVSTTSLKLLNGISWNLVVMKYMVCRWAYLQEILIQIFFVLSYALFILINIAKIKCRTEIICHRNSSKPLNRISRNFFQYRSYGQTVNRCIYVFSGNFYLIFFLREKLEFWPKYTFSWNLCKTGFSMSDSEAIQSDIFLIECPNVTQMWQ